MIKPKLPSKKQLLIIGAAILIVAAAAVIWWQIAPRNNTSSTKQSLFRGAIKSVLPEEPKSKEFGLMVEKLKINAPVIVDVDGNNEGEYLKAVEKGVAHYQDTGLPGKNGNVFIFGHSSYWKWAVGDYKTVFKELDKMEKDDIIIVWYKSVKYEYKVIEKRIIEATDMSAISQETDGKKILSLMTCWPPGTVEKRYLVKAVLK
ncbi:MAG: Uncharacterized protein CEN88_51 [Candidatus Berkelbacteria bacterium Licking1014_2]|uniref:Sortase family protein n=1 Tax=Candidatus Berkelbacteria bacterium Licking1014_2 TaxID=2017146 RepID=A0A554LX05_9BACT|nr:MAG: Uncharacterized protein CEN88_51 [Candidatus Berkelbacteria bacterium Licking1014_2]